MTRHLIWLNNNWVHNIGAGVYGYVSGDKLFCKVYVMGDYGFLVAR